MEQDAAPASGRESLRFRPTSFIGRRADLDALSAALSHEPLVTVLGPPGIGKTRLAERYLEERGGGSAWICDLTEASSIDELCTAVGRALDVPLHGGGSAAAVEQLGAALAGRGPVLLVLDNFEHVVAHAAATVGRWIRLAPAAHFLVTSRERLRLTGEVILDLGPLSLPESVADAAASEAVQLFVNRARAVSGGYALGEEEAARVVELVRALDGNPLAIELAAARRRVLTMVELLEGLPQSLEVLTGNAVDASRRHVSLRDAIAWSWSSLRPWEQSALAQSAVFRGGFGVRAAEDVLDLSAFPGAPPVLDVILALRDKSLLVRHEHPADRDRARFRLYMGVREFADERLEESGARDAVEARHARHYLRAAAGWAAAADKRAGPGARRHLVVEAENLIAVHRRAVGRSSPGVEHARWAIEVPLALSPILMAQGPATRLMSLLDAALALPSVADVDLRLRARAHEARGRAYRMLGHNEACFADLERALSLAERVGDRGLLGAIRCTLAWAHYFCARYAEAEVLLVEAMAAGDRWHEGRALALLGPVRQFLGQPLAALEALEAALRIHREVGDLRAEGMTNGNRGVLEIDLEQFEDAERHSDRAQAIYRSLGERRNEALVAGSRAQIAHRRGRFEAAERLFEESIHILGEIGDRQSLGEARGRRGIMEQQREQWSRAQASYEQALADLEGLEGWEEPLFRGWLGSLHATLGRIPAARACFDAAERRVSREQQIAAVLEVLRGHLDLALARAAAAAGDAHAASAHEREARGRIARFAPVPSPPAQPVPHDVRTAIDGLERAIARREPAAPCDVDPPRSVGERNALVVERNGRWLRTREGSVVSVQGKRTLSALLQILTARRMSAPNEPLSPEALFEAIWPGVALDADVGAHRVHTAIWTLRKLGLKEIIIRHQGGYMIDPDIPVRCVDGEHGDAGSQSLP